MQDRSEEYLETILYLTQGRGMAKTSEIAEELGVSPSSVTEMIQKLSEGGYVEYVPYYGVTLTQQGNMEASRIKRRHQLLETFLVEFLKMNKDDAHREACKLEHVISDDIERRFCSMMGHPEKCPDGNPIERASCCFEEDTFP
ncbi:MAG: metal-dependent transcriptional regulator [Methanocellales archaeon]|nr:metal-dependent transcriptional regulator [Methanocellales archaeon]MDD3292258.1 metal-dependent transcriptional regulator [Methanocellales archaeon]MDD5484874.1 metal-dependent transcriptional regulator [Methanocellales archaeon]